MAKKDFTFVLTGDKQINRALAALKEKDAKDAVRKSARTVLKWMLPAVKAATPKRSGALGNDLRVKAIKRSRTRIGLMITTKARLFKGKTFYGGFQEWGWKTGSRSGKTRNVGFNVLTGKIKITRRTDNRVRKAVPGKFFIKKTTDKRRQSALTRYRIELRKHIEAEASKYL